MEDLDLCRKCEAEFEWKRALVDIGKQLEGLEKLRKTDGDPHLVRMSEKGLEYLRFLEKRYEKIAKRAKCSCEDNAKLTPEEKREKRATIVRKVWERTRNNQDPDDFDDY